MRSPAVDERDMQQRLSGIPTEVWGRLFPFQRAGVTRGVQHGGRCLLADEMGLGKTVQVQGFNGNRLKKLIPPGAVLGFRACAATRAWGLLADNLYDWARLVRVGISGCRAAFDGDGTLPGMRAGQRR